jgi:hypothetical protein
VDANRYNLFTNFRSLHTFNFDPRVATPGIFDPVPIEPGVWTHLAIVREGNTNYSVYKDGALFDTATETAPLPTALGWTMSGRPGFQYHGLLDEVRISGVALTPQQFLIGSPVTVILEPGTACLFGIGVSMFALTRRKRRRS